MGMYCRACYYDLRGQDTPRCPECGRAFDPGDPGSFLDHPGRLHRIRIAYKKPRIPCAILLTSVWAIWMLFGTPLLDTPRCVDVRHPLSSHLRGVAIRRMLWQQQDPPIRDFDRAAAIRDWPPLVSAHTLHARSERRKRLGRIRHCVTFYAVPTAIFALLLITLVRCRRRWLALGVLVLCGALVPASHEVFEVADALIPEDPLPAPSHAYLDDYVHIDGIQFTSSDDWGNTTIAAYDIRSFEGDGRRIVAFANTHVRSLGDDEAKALFEAQGLEYPVHTEAEADE